MTRKGQYTAIALEAVPEAVATWYCYFTLYRHPLQREHESPSVGLNHHHRA